MDQELENLLKCGFLFIDKPRGPSSHEVSAYIRKLLQIKKAGHAGTLDPNVSGVLIIGLNKATRLLRFIAKDKKTYVGVMRIKKPISDINKVPRTRIKEYVINWFSWMVFYVNDNAY
jgi:H/ACA ribonucleoprotein complex subunit 4